MSCPDNYSQWASYEAQMERELARLPVCYECGEPIQDERCYKFDGELICQSCLEANHEVDTYDYII